MDRVLLLDKNEEILQITNWRRALVLLMKGKAECAESINKIEEFIKIDDTYIPRIIKLKYEMAIPEKELPFSRENILRRDNFTCQYCGKKLPIKELTLDHVYPKSRLGPDIWENLVACCKECNQKKADKTPKEAHMKLLKRPERPKDKTLFEFSKFEDEGTAIWLKYYREAS